MLRSIKSLHGCTVAARDGDIGSVDDVYFDDEAWGVRYLVVDTGNWMRERQVLISPYSAKHMDRESGTVHVHLARQQVRDSPNIDTHKPVSRQHETEYLLYYGYPTYWGGLNLWGMGSSPAFDIKDVPPDPASEALPRPDPDPHQAPVDVHLHSTNAVEGYHIEVADGSIGHVSGFIFDDVAWAIRYLTVDTRNWWPGGKEVLVATRWIDLIDWVGSTVSTRLSRDAIRSSPEYDDSVPLTRDYEKRLHEFHGRDGYW
ncbi:PRC-barrel domain containing protein [Paraburkholderia madseniana]|uniref:PRC-barrel domain containing protein n=1 Tax=Paraburkholderia madseniana TaxID=2599607 RepID=A0A6N6W4X6_9BURK|nr:PRC-barrel domain-containing protein [Paraburkholderia madseniana]KAE8755466.1 PRC-barrel domain containing protein [Paraburkholderia madseniana]